MTSGELPRPGLIGRALRLGLAAVLGLTIVSLFTGLRKLLFGTVPLEDPGFWVLLGFLIAFSGLMVQQVSQRPVAGIVTILLIGSGLATGLVDWALTGTPFGRVFGVFVWYWALVFSTVLGVAFVLAAVLGTPGCEMGVYGELIAKGRGAKSDHHRCPGCIDRLDGMRLLGRW